jgi:TPR repeat protein
VIQAAAEQGDALAQAQVGAVYYLDKGVMQDRSVAARWLKKAADQGLVEAVVMMGALSDVGLGVPSSARDAKAWYQKSSCFGF